jgi:hypothetical protein
MVAIQSRAPQIRDEARVWGPRIPIGLGTTNFAEALASLFEDPTIDDPAAGSNPLTSRLISVLTASADSFAPNMSHFSGIFRDWTDDWPKGRRGDTGFKPDFQDYDLWPGSSMQVSHFMTAVDMGFQPRKLSNFVKLKIDMYSGAAAAYSPMPVPPGPDPDSPIRPDWWSFGESDCVDLMIAHEKVPDSGVYGQEPNFSNKVATISTTVTETDRNNFRSAFVGLGPGQNDPGKAKAALSPIAIGSGSGNSRQDLLLSVFGFKFGAMIRTVQLTEIAQGANWIRVNLKDPRTP